MGKKAKKVFLSIIRYILLLAAFVAAFYAIDKFYSKESSDSYTPPITPVEVVSAEDTVVKKSMNLSSYVEAKDIVTVVPYVDGTILELYVEEGDYVHKGDLIALIDPEPYKLQLAQAESGYYGYASSFEKVEKLYKQGIASKQDYDSLKAQYDAMNAQLELAKLQLSYTEVRAKTSGTVQKTILSKGSTASKGAPIAIISDLDNLVVNLKVGEKYFGLFNENPDSLEIEIVRPESEFTSVARSKATISSVSQYIDPTSKNFDVQVTIDENKGAFRPGMFVKATIVYSSKEGSALKRSDVMGLDGGVYYVEDSKAVYIDLSDAFMNENYVIVPDRIKDKSFISRGSSSVISGQEVNIVKGAN